MTKTVLLDLQGFNTQPPEGGWLVFRHFVGGYYSFNTQPPEGGWLRARPKTEQGEVSTHSRLKAAGGYPACFKVCINVSTHSRLKAAGASLKSLAPSGLAAPISLGSQEKREREYNTAFSVTPAFAIS